MEFTTATDGEFQDIYPQTSPSFILIVQPAKLLRFASKKRLSAFYRSNKIVPFGVNRAENAFQEKMCKTASFFAAYAEIFRPQGQTGAIKDPD